jgi:hypothetical protein
MPVLVCIAAAIQIRLGKDVRVDRLFLRFRVDQNDFERLVG